MGSTTLVNGDGLHHSSRHIIDTPFLIVGAGPAGGSLACFLSHPPYSMTGLLISNASTTSQTPRAHITNPACFECLRDIGLEERCVANAVAGDCMTHTRWCHDMTGEEYARIYSWGNDPKRYGEYEGHTPCRHVDLPQTEFEPILIQRAMAEGWDVRFRNSFVSSERESDGKILSKVRDDLTGAEYYVRSKFLFGADGGRSQVIRELGIPLIKKPGQGLALNVLVDVDLSDYVDARKGNLHWVFQPEEEYEDYAWSGLIRMVKPWNQWMFILFPKPNVEYKEPSIAQWEKVCRKIVGNDKLPLRIVNVSKWLINETVAEYYSDPTNTIHCLGDAVHRHPPFNGLGSNTCVQDAYNLAWKVKYVCNGLADHSLLNSYSPERQPVGLGVITRANQGLRDHTPVWDAMGLTMPTPKERMAVMAELKSATPEGRKRRQRLNKAIDGTAQEFHGIGVEMNHRYESKAIVADDETGEPPAWPEDKVLYHLTSTYPGSRLPHAWLNKRMPQKEHVSTQDLAGKGVFCLFTGIGGEGWKKAAEAVSKDLGIEIRAYSIGWEQDWEDVYRDWARKCEVEEDGCVLARPDRVVAWRAKTSGDEQSRLDKVIRKVLGK
ncbi:2,4-dichlorophenol 6-monooxygenase [Cyphellophora attinorum]|uniref:2,4-dichlorophenol 6-monooxygenase n=1 Tax=Cyphellophora attinorum TaxID=1664694 RepID=A0A0N0NPC1_9EURO|nr:2,4-dichlorophenol 6-monooxygenase [Phialophora attinorum]KPI42581.1 2,4-dichlorophenol 6-monooxygenase [Phialophora attinorum]